mgnify:CR=1 FL=1
MLMLCVCFFAFRFSLLVLERVDSGVADLYGPVLSLQCSGCNQDNQTL